MIEWLIPAALVTAAFIPKRKPNDHKNIELIFKRLGIGVPNKNGDPIYPKRAKSTPIMLGDEQIGIRYNYKMPVGISPTKLAKPENTAIFQDAIGKPVTLECKEGYFRLNVYYKDIPTRFVYGEIVKHKNLEEWQLPLGRSLSKMIWHNFDHIPHMTVAGTTRFGKTAFLKLLMSYLIDTHGEDVEFFIIDLKGGLAFKKYECVRQVKCVARNVKEAHDLLFYLTNEQTEIELKNKKGEVYKTIELPLGQIQKDEELFLRNGWEDITETPIKRRRFIIVDEAAQLAPDSWMKTEQKQQLGFCQWSLSEIARIGGGLGYRLIFATQYPTADTLPRQIKQNADGKITFRLPSGYASEVAIDEKGAESLTTEFKGRALYKTHELNEMQVPFITDAEMWKIFSKYQEPILLEGVPENVIEYEEATTEGRKDTVTIGKNGVRH